MEKDNLFTGRFLNVKNIVYNDKKYEAVVMNDAVAVLVLNQDKSKLLLVKQYRPVYGDYTYEIPAGMRDINGEDPRECIARELEEEANIEIDYNSLVHLIDYIHHFQSYLVRKPAEF